MLELYRRQAGSSQVAPLGVVKQPDVVEDIRPGVLPHVADTILIRSRSSNQKKLSALALLW